MIQPTNSCTISECPEQFSTFRSTSKYLTHYSSALFSILQHISANYSTFQHILAYFSKFQQVVLRNLFNSQLRFLHILTSFSKFQHILAMKVEVIPSFFLIHFSTFQHFSAVQVLNTNTVNYTFLHILAHFHMFQHVLVHFSILDPRRQLLQHFSTFQCILAGRINIETC